MVFVIQHDESFNVNVYTTVCIVFKIPAFLYTSCSLVHVHELYLHHGSLFMPLCMCMWVLNDSLSGQYIHTHGRRARHSSSGSSGSDSSSESGSSSQRSRSPSPEAQTQPEIPSQQLPLTFSKEVFLDSFFIPGSSLIVL